MTAPVFDANSPYADASFELIKSYVRLRAPGHAVADKRGRVMAHRAVLFVAIGPGPHDCALCGWPGLRWDVDRTDPSYLVPDHVDGDGFNNRLDNLRPVDKWCNDNRAIADALGLSWSTWAGVPPEERPPLRNVHTGAPTRAAYELANEPAERSESEPPCRRRESAPAAPVAVESPWMPGRPVVWANVIDLGELARGKVVLRPPPAELVKKYPVLGSIDFGVFGR